ncbi:hypothetical protein HWB80_gp083 [Streptomyces phage Karimac]|uniref:Uncharacterized protein n=1 Tax=Streptomyces phage Karimac TaxID=2283303 RepID=A0A345MHS0_9CAUD|nr:hypothetical protein HWB80_gp083 [Streptomyces phage Karimac]AXH70101.1 hypothetical protein SEA_KARIMAC_239 [Streptomyces phage Karimac]
MHFDNEVAVSIYIEDLTRDIWRVIRLVLAHEATQEDIRGAEENAKYLRLYLSSYDSRRYSYLPDSTVWLANEVADAVDDLID